MKNDHLEKNQADYAKRRVDRLLQSSLPVEGDLRLFEYSLLVNEAASELYDRMFGERGKKSHKRFFCATCCGAYGEERELTKRGHPRDMLVEVGPWKKMDVRSSADLHRFIIGLEPPVPEQPWIVQYPRTLVDCTFTYPGQPVNSFTELAQALVLKLEDKRKLLGKRDFEDLDSTLSNVMNNQEPSPGKLGSAEPAKQSGQEEVLATMDESPEDLPVHFIDNDDQLIEKYLRRIVKKLGKSRTVAELMMIDCQPDPKKPLWSTN